MGSWAGQPALRVFDPLYDRQLASAVDQAVVAQEGYAVGAIQVDADQFVNAVQVVFMRVTSDGQLDKNDSYTSDWIGDASGKPPVKVGGTGAKVIGVHGRKAAVLDAVGLVMESEG
jgi:hypothetical protein